MNDNNSSKSQPTFCSRFRSFMDCAYLENILVVVDIYIINHALRPP